ncbi:MAG: tRNA epoxyqueuosine(34) reductase QueG [Acidobacteria bacterium]|nr:tRNA epoxyqueuosine(34) reductase QueG [Acidobacteriota bacterium]MBI3656971.1 tRNA epoxyqueuosine(34) reductase QueG [Acidobacteriota bacterium]
MTLTEQIKAKALELGFDKVGVSPANVPSPAAFLTTWLANGYHGDMRWLARAPERRMDPRKVLPGARSVISLATNYYTEAHTQTDHPDIGKLSRYAWGDDYHPIILKRLRRLHDDILAREPGIQTRYYVDTGPVMEKAFAQQSGLGWIGKHTNVITEEYGSWMFLSEILVTAVLDYDLPADDQCGHCRLCIDACPTEAIVAPYVLDARRCIPYLTIELRSDIPEDLRPLMGNHVFGCDICQEVCPWNAQPVITKEAAFRARATTEAASLASFAECRPEDFNEIFHHSAVKRAKWAGLLRNVMVAIGNSRNPHLIPVLKRALARTEAMVSTHAKWALARLRSHLLAS